MPSTPLTANKNLQSAAAASTTNAATAASKPLIGKVETKEELKYAKFTCSRNSMQIVTDKGVKLAFIAKTLMVPVDDEPVLEYLQDQIKRKGIPGLAYDGEVTSAERDPMAALEARVREEVRKEMIAAALKEAESANPAGASGVATSNQAAS